MMTTLDTLLDDIRTRKSVSAGGISVAESYVKAMEPCLSGSGLCPVKLFGLASADQWQKELTDSASRLTYCDKATADPDFLVKSVREGADIASGAVLEYDCILSSKRKDRDGDIVEQKGGLNVDQKMPLLWQHIQVQPIGKHIAVLDQDETATKCRFAIANTELGRDAAVLVKFGALRKSMGFKPFKFEPVEIIKGVNGEQLVRGWHIKEAGAMEGSLVSIPANPDANVLSFYEKEFDGLATAYSRNLLKNAAMKLWAKGVYQARPLQIPGVTLDTKAASNLSTQGVGAIIDNVISANTGGGQSSAGPAQATAPANTPKGSLPADASGMNPMNVQKCPDCGSTLNANGKCTKCNYQQENDGSNRGQGKSLANLAAKDFADTINKMYAADSPYLEGSFEDVQYDLGRTASKYLRDKELIDDEYYGYASIAGTFSDFAIVCYRRNSKSMCWRIAWEMKDGEAVFTGEPVAVEIKTQIVEKAFDRESPAALSRKLLAMSLTQPRMPGLQKALDDLSGHAQLLRQQNELLEFNELLGIDL